MLLHLCQIIAKEEHAEGRSVVHKHTAFPVQHAAARRNDGHVAPSVALVHRAGRVGVADLKLPEAAIVFSNVSPAGVGRKPSWRTGSRNALEFLPDRRLRRVAVAAGIKLL